MRFPLCATAIFLGCAASSFATLSSNLIVGGDFESPNAIKTESSPRTAEEMSLAAIPNWGFHPGGIAAEAVGGYNVGDYFTDLGKWIGHWGISSVPDPHPHASGTSPNNVSTVTRDASSTKVMEGARFRSWVAQVVQAPANQVAGQATINFDYWFNQWEESPLDADSIFHVWIGGLTTLPTYLDRSGPINGSHLDGSDGDPQGPGKWTLNPLWDSPNWSSLWDPTGQSWVGIGAMPDKPLSGSLGQTWYSLSSSNPQAVNFTINQTYPYYYLSVWECVYSEPHYYSTLKWPVPQMAVAIDNIDFRVSVNVVLADCNLDGQRNALDISGFIQRVTSGTYQAEADCNQDGYVNALDIAKFIYYVTGGTGDSQVIPEPATIGLLALATLVAGRRRR